MGWNMKKTILTIVLFLSLFFVSSNVFAVDIEEGTVRCQYYKEVCEEKEGKNTCREDMVTLTFDVTEGSSKLTIVTVRIDNVIDEVREKHTTLFTGVTGTAKCPSSIDLTVKTDENNNKVFTLTKPSNSFLISSNLAVVLASNLIVKLGPVLLALTNAHPSSNWTLTPSKSI